MKDHDGKNPVSEFISNGKSILGSIKKRKSDFPFFSKQKGLKNKTFFIHIL